MLQKNSLPYLVFIFLILSSCAKRTYFVADPFWESATGISLKQVRLMGLRSGTFVRIAGTNSVWLAEGDAAQANSPSLLPQIEGWLDAGYKVILSPYWRRDLEKNEITSQNGQLVLIDVSNPQFQSVLSNMEGGFNKLGQAAGAYVQNKVEREQAIAIFYRGTQYDRYYESFAQGYQIANIDINSLAPMRYYAAEINDIYIALESIEASKNLIIIAMGHLSSRVFHELSGAKDSLLITENYGSGDDPDDDPLGNVLLSLDTDYKQLLETALSLKPGEEPEKVPYVLKLPNPALLSDTPGFEKLAQESFERQRRKYNRLDRRISRWWNRLLDFFADQTIIG